MRYVLIPIVALFVLVASWRITVPGLYYDEVFQNVSALAFVRGGLPSPTSWLPDSEISIAGRRFPLMSMQYIGGVKTAAFVPVAALAGVTPQSVRYFSITLGALTLIATFAFVRRLFGPATAVAAALLTVGDPSFIAFTRVDYGPVVIMLLTKMTALWLLALWWKSDRVRHLAAAWFLLGLGLYDKANFLWIIGATLAAGVIVFPMELVRRSSVRNVCGAVVGFCAGAAPFIWFNIKYPLVSFDLSAFYVAVREPNATLLDRIQQRLAVLRELLDGEAFPAWAGHAGVSILPIMLIASVVGVGVHTWKTGQWRASRPFAFVLLCAAFTLLAAAATRGGSQVHHVILVYPLPHILIGCGVVLAATLIARTLPAPGTLVPTIVAGIVAGAVAWTGIMHYRSQIIREEQVGGWSSWSTAIYDLQDYLSSTTPTEDVMAIDWGIFMPLVGLSQGTLRVSDLQSTLRSTDPVVADRVLQPHFSRPGTRYVLHAPKMTLFQNARARFLEAAQAHERTLTLDRTISRRDGTPIFEVYRVGLPADAQPPQVTSTSSVSGPSIVASPNPVPAGEGAGTATIRWETKGAPGQVYFEVTWPGGGQPERLLAEGASGSQALPWINAGADYQFRLYAGTDHKTLLSAVTVRRSAVTNPSPGGR